MDTWEIDALVVDVAKYLYRATVRAPDMQFAKAYWDAMRLVEGIMSPQALRLFRAVK